jgi:hypothetical protein
MINIFPYHSVPLLHLMPQVRRNFNLKSFKITRIFNPMSNYLVLWILQDIDMISDKQELHGNVVPAEWEIYVAEWEIYVEQGD